MLKIYLKTIINEIHSDGVEYDISHDSFYTIEDEDCAQSFTREYKIYGDEIQHAYTALDVYEKKRGRVVYVSGDDCFLKFKQWKEPNAKFVQYVHYKECSCSMDRLFKMPADKVIAYLKQEGINTVVSS